MKRSSVLTALTLRLPFYFCAGSAFSEPYLGLDPHSIVSSDGLVYSPSEAATQPQGVSSFQGRGMRSDTLAEFPERKESAAEVWALVAREPAPVDNGRETVIGADSRTRLTPTTSFPARDGAHRVKPGRRQRLHLHRLADQRQHRSNSRSLRSHRRSEWLVFD